MKSLDEIWDEIKDFTLQHKEEFLWLLQLIIMRKYKSVLEIGSYKGGSARGFLEVGCIVTCIDNNPTAELVRLTKHTFCSLITADSKELDYPQNVYHDVLLIDGDHSYVGCESDFRKFKGRVVPGGAIIFHDINPKDENNKYGSSVFWNEIKHQYQYEEKIVHPETWGGIGVLYV